MVENLLILNDEIIEELFTLTNGGATLCFQCGICSACCPWGLVKDNTFSIRYLLRNAQIEFNKANRDLWLCTTCGQCELHCPRGVNIMNIFQSLRYLSWKRNLPLEGLSSMLWSVYWHNNPWDQPPSQRPSWAKNLKIPIFNQQDHEILYYVGCTVSYDFRAQKIAQSLVEIFRTADVAFGFLGDQEPCSGEEVLSVGHYDFFKDLSIKAINTFSNFRVSHLVTSDPHSYDAFTNHYKSSLTGFHNHIKIQHYSEFLEEIIKDGRLCFPPKKQWGKKKITYHDPCYLSRINKLSQAPRFILESIPNIELIEMNNTGHDTLCCGGGGGRMWMDTAIGERFSDLRVMEALETGAEILATACPYCISCLEDSINAQGIEKLIVMDVAEIVALVLR